MEEEKLIKERKEKIIAFLKKDNLFSIFLVLAGLALIFSLWVQSRFMVSVGFVPLARISQVINAFSAGDWFLLFLLALLSSACVYYKKVTVCFYPILAWIIWISVKIRMLPTQINPSTNKPGLWDITRDSWTLGPDLDPFLFLRWTKDIVAHGILSAHDTLRYVPLGFNTKEELVLNSYFIAWFHKITAAFGNTSVDYSAVIYPVVMFAIGLVAFYFLVRELFIDEFGENIASTISLVASFLITVIPVLLPRTIAGIPEKEASALVFLFCSFYFFLKAWKEKKTYHSIIFTLLAIGTTTLMSLVWGGYIYLYLTIGLATAIAFFAGQTTRKTFAVYSAWVLGSMMLTSALTARYSFQGFLLSTIGGIAVFVALLMFVQILITESSVLRRHIEKGKLAHIPKQVTAVGIVVAVLIIGSFALGPTFLQDKMQNVVNQLVTPTTDRLGVTVAENRQPFYDEWAGNFGPSLYSLVDFSTFSWLSFSQQTVASWSQIPLFFWLFFFGSILLFFQMMKSFPNRERILLTLGYAAFLFALIFSRYRGDSILNGTSNMSIFVYASGFFILLFVLGRKGNADMKRVSLYYKSAALSFFLLFLWTLYLKESFFAMILFGLSFLWFGALVFMGIAKEEKYRALNPGIVMLFAFFFLSIISARGAVRLIMVLSIPASIMVAYLVILTVTKMRRVNSQPWKAIAIVLGILILISTLFSAFSFYEGSKGQAQGSVPYSYTFQWQKAMSWVRDNTPQNAVFSHWWDYGYWVQSIGERATVLDGGNAIAYWNHLMGRYALTAPEKDEQEALSYLYTHNVTHFLIDSTDIGKYTAFSSIGSDLNWDRRSWIQTMIRSPTDKNEVKNGTRVWYYPGSQKYQAVIPLDEDIFYSENITNSTNRSIALLSERSGIIGISLEIDASGAINSQPQVVIFYRSKDQQKEEVFPLRYAYFNKSLHDFGFGLDAGVFFMNNLQSQGGGLGFEKDGALLFLSAKTVHSQLARLYLYNEGTDPHFKLVHSQDSPIVEQIKPQAKDIDLGDIVFYGGVQGPIRIWEVHYPEDIQVNATYLQKNFPDMRLVK